MEMENMEIMYNFFVSRLLDIWYLYNTIGGFK